MTKCRIKLLPEAEMFVESLPQKVGDKIFYNILRISQGDMSSTLFKKLVGTEIWELRTLYSKTSYRLFAFWDTKNEALIIATHGIIKKTQETPKKEIAKAEKIRIQYFKAKDNE